MENVINVKEILERIKRVKNLGSQTELADFLGVAKGTVSNWVARNSIDYPRVISKLEDVDLNWLLTGKGEPERHPRYCHSEWVDGEVRMIYHPKSPEVMDDRSITLYDVTAAANLKSLFSDKDQHALGKIVIPNIPACDGAIYVNGDSMYPILKSGDIVGYKLTNSRIVMYGEIYIVAFELDGDEYLAVKYVNRSELPDHIKLVSYNEHHGPMDIPLECISTMAIVKFMIRKF